MRNVFLALKLLGDRYETWMVRITEVETFKDLVCVVLLLGAGWALAWYAHVISPWLEALLGWQPSSVDSAAKISWRRIWATAICLPGIIAAASVYLRIRWRRAGRG